MYSEFKYWNSMLTLLIASTKTVRCTDKSTSRFKSELFSNVVFCKKTDNVVSRYWFERYNIRNPIIYVAYLQYGFV